MVFLGVSYLYWTILAFIIAVILYIVKVSPLVIPKDPNRWILKKFIFYYAHSIACLFIGWMFFKMWKNNSATWFSWVLGGVGILLICVYIVAFILDRIRIKKLKQSYSSKN